jgi:hypothetical protein
MSRLRLPPRVLDAGKEADSGRGQMVLLPARARSAGARPSSQLVVVPPPRAMPSAVGALVAPRRSPPPGSCATAWPQRQVLRRLSEERWCVSVDICVDVRTLVGVSVVVACRPARWWHWCAAVRLVGSQTTLTSVAIPLTGLLLHRD